MVQFKPREYRDFFGKLAKSRVLTADQADRATQTLTQELHLRGMVWALNRYFEVVPGVRCCFRPEVEGGNPDFLVWKQDRVLLAVETLAEPKPMEALYRQAEAYINELDAGEVFFFFPANLEHERFEAFHPVNGETRRIGMWMKRWHSSELNLDFTSPDGWLRIFDVRASTQLMTPIEMMEVRFDKERG